MAAGFGDAFELPDLGGFASAARQSHGCEGYGGSWQCGLEPGQD
jgi:hypothetical protein